MHVCDQRFLSSGLAEINETWHNNNTTPVVDARRTILRFDSKWPPGSNLHKCTKSCIWWLEMHVCDQGFLSFSLAEINET